jgi:CRP-like cAMP-binding protein
MAFGGGALLAALTIDLVASSVSKGYFTPLGIGCILGGVLFVILNEVVNDYGGFIRKTSTTFFHLNRSNIRHMLRTFSSIRKVDELQGLNYQDYRALSASMTNRTYKKGTLIYRAGDPCDELFIVDSGDVEILNPKQGGKVMERLERYDVFDWFDFLTGCPTVSQALAATDVTVWVIPRGAFYALLPNSTILLQKIRNALGKESLVDYLVQKQGLERTECEMWAEHSVETLLRRGTYSGAKNIEHNDDEFIEIVNSLQNFTLFHNLPQDEIEEISGKLIYKRHPSGTTLYHDNYLADRMYFIAKGEVSLIHPENANYMDESRGANSAFGSFAFLSGSRHSSTAITTTETELWVLRKSDLNEILPDTPIFAAKLKQFIESDKITSYLRSKQHYDIDRITHWKRKYLTAISTETALPFINELGFEFNINEHKGAPVAIWLGILLDGIPESLVIGASLSQSNISLSLLGGLFLSNYPEALSSSAGMRQQGFRFGRILLMWTSIMLLTGIGAAFGNIFFTGASPSLFALVQGIAAGAMLTMISQTMLPEAYLKGGTIIGFSTLLGFLAAIFLKTLE